MLIIDVKLRAATPVTSAGGEKSCRARALGVKVDIHTIYYHLRSADVMRAVTSDARTAMLLFIMTI